jgi:hypothetical protein
MDTPWMSEGGAMVTASTGKHKTHSSPTPSSTKAKKKAFIKRLAAGDAPGTAAQAIGAARSTAYDWKKNDARFAADWENAVETSLDNLETELHGIAKKDPDNVSARIKAIELTLKARRPRDWCNSNNNNNGDRVVDTQNNYFLNVPMEEHIERLQRLGLPVPVIEADYEVIDAASDSKDNP